MGADAVRTQDLGRIYNIRGPKHKSQPRTLVALEDVNLNIAPGELFGLLGPNGAGKTTLLKILSNLLQEPIYLASGFYFPVRAMGFWVATFASILPLTLGLDALRQLLFEAGPALGFLPVPVEASALALLSVIFIGAAYQALRKLETRGRQDGRLIEKRR